MFASLQGYSEITMGNVIGSNISNILLVLGLVAIFSTVQLQRSAVTKEIPFSLFGVILLMVFVNEIFVGKATEGVYHSMTALYCFCFLHCFSIM